MKDLLYKIENLIHKQSTELHADFVLEALSAIENEVI